LFLIHHISELVSFDEEETNLSADGLEISFNTKNTIDFELKWDFIDDIFKLSRVSKS
jgi:hypothetical protein